MKVRRFCICSVFCALLLSTGVYPQSGGRTAVPPRLQEELDYIMDDPDCTLEDVEELEAELAGLYPADDYVFFWTNLKKFDVYALSDDYDMALEHLDSAKRILKKHTRYDDADAAELEEDYGDMYFAMGDSDEGLKHFKNAIRIEEKLYGASSIEVADTYQSIGSCYYDSAEYDKALEHYGRALELYKNQLGEMHPDTATSCNDIGNVYADKGDYDKALGYYGRALNIRKKQLGEKHPDTAQSYNNIGFVYEAKGDYDKALEYHIRALEIWKKQLGEKHPDTATSYNNIGTVYVDKGDYGKALEYYGRALNIRKNQLGEEHLDTAQSYNNIGTVYAGKGDCDKALEYYGRALNVRKKLLGEEHPDTAISYNDIGLVYEGKGDYDKALEYYGRALNIRKNQLGEEHPATAQSYNNIGNVYADKGDYDKALEYYGRSLNIRKNQLGDEHPDTAQSYNNIGFVYEAKGGYDKALEYHIQALEIWKKLLGEEHPDTATSYNNIGVVYEDKEDYGNALEYHGRALKIRKKLLGEEHPDTALSYSNLGWLYHDQQKYPEAVSYWKKSFTAIQKSRSYATSLNLLSKYIFSGITDKAFLGETLSLASGTVERARLDMASMKDSLLKEALPIYYFGVDFEVKNKNLQKAFDYSEALRSRGFLDQMGTEAALRLDGVTDSERSQVQQLETQISVARTELERQGKLPKGERDEKRYKKAGDDLAKAEKELSALDEKIGKRLPAYVQLRNPRPIDVKSAQKWCGKKRAVLEYVMPDPELNKTDGDSKDADKDNAGIGSWCIVVTGKKVQAVSLDSDFDYNAAVNRLRKAVGKGRAEYQFEKERNDLYAHLIAPVLPMLSGIEELVIVPDGSLSSLPFDMLRKDEMAECLGDDYAVSFSPSVSVSVLADSHKAKSDGVLAFGGAWYDTSLSEQEHRRAYSGEGGRGVDRGSLATEFELKADNDAQLAYMRSHIREYGPGDYFRQKSLSWKDLPGTVTEVNTLRENIFTSGKYDERMQKDATEAELKRLSSAGNLKEYSVLHLACHGYFDRNIAEMSSVLFSEVSGKLSGVSAEDGYLTITETALLNLDADMVCLSACETGLGELRRGDGMVGLSRAFMVAGAKRVGVSLWCIDDEATAEFMTRMYRKVEKEGKSYSSAYREVKAEFRADEKWGHPYYWAAFVLYE